jgi:hypothetical protein
MSANCNLGDTIFAKIRSMDLQKIVFSSKIFWDTQLKEDKKPLLKHEKLFFISYTLHTKIIFRSGAPLTLQMEHCVGSKQCGMA